MTTQKSFSENKVTPNRRFFNLRYFMFQLKTGWPLFVALVFIFILSMVIPSVNYMTGSFDVEIKDVADMFRHVKETLVESVYILGAINIVLSMGCGFLCALNVLKFVNNKVAVNFYHSLPIRREALFVTSVLHSFVYYVVAFGAGLSVTFITFALKLGSVGLGSESVLLLRPVLLTFLYGVIFFLLVYSMTLFASSLTGTGIMRFIGAGYVIFLPVAMFMSFLVAVGNLGMHREIIDIDYYITPENLMGLCAPLRLANLVGESDTGDFMMKSPLSIDVLVVLVITVVMLVLAFFLYLRRPSESAARPVIWKGAAFVFKYSSMFLGGTIFALMFDGMFGNSFWMLVGTVFGSFITFMIVNGILSKSARAIFNGIRGFAVFMVIMFAIAVVFYMDVFGIFTKVPSASFVNEVEVTLNYDIDAKYTGEDAKKVVELIEKAYKEGGNGTGYPEIEYIVVDENGEEVIEIDPEMADIYPKEAVDGTHLYSSHTYDHYVIHATFHTKLGIPYAVRINSNCEAAKELAIFVDSTVEKTPLPAASEIVDGAASIYIENHKSRGLFDTKLTNEEIVRYVGMLSDPTGVKCESPIVGNINFYTDGENDNYMKMNVYYITAKDIDVLNKLYLGEPFESEDDVIDLYIEENSIRYVYVVDNKTGDAECIKNTDDIKAVIKALRSFDGYGYDEIVCTKDHTYNVFLYSSDPEVMMYDHQCFRKDAVPDFVK